MPITVPDFLPATTEIFMLFSILMVTLIGIFKLNASQDILDYLAPCFTLCALVILILLPNHQVYSFSGGYINDHYAFIAKLVLLVCNSLILLLSKSVNKYENLKIFEIPILIMLATLGMMFVISASDIIVAFVSLELTSFSIYILTAMDREHKASAEAGMKYFIYGAIATALFLFGLSFIYGMTGGTHFEHIANDLSNILLNQQDTTLISVGVVLITIAFMFKLGAAPLHYWLPDVYQGTKLTITTLIATTPKFAVLILMGRIYSHMLSDFIDIWQPILFAFAVMSFLLGTMGAYTQTNIKRFLAYSSTMNIGFVLAAMATFAAHGYGASILYMSIYMVTLMIIFAAFMALKKRNYDIVNIVDLKGVSEKYPYVGFVICLCFLSLAGLPPLPGFVSKLYILYALLLDDHYVISVIVVISTVIACAYYLKILKTLIVDSIDKVLRTYRTKHTGMLIKIVVFFLMGTLLFALIMPNLWIQFFHNAAIDLLH